MPQKLTLALLWALFLPVMTFAQVENLADENKDAAVPADPAVNPVFAEDTVANAPPIVITANPLEERDPFSVPYSLDIVPAFEEDSPKSPRTIIDALGDLPSVTAQRTAYGQGSPFLRGYTSFRTLVLVDGIRINHAVCDPGPIFLVFI